MLRRYKFARASFAIEGLHPTPEIAALFDQLILMECEPEEMLAIAHRFLLAGGHLKDR
jgi:hypothetical protein